MDRVEKVFYYLLERPRRGGMIVTIGFFFFWIMALALVVVGTGFAILRWIVESVRTLNPSESSVSIDPQTNMAS